MRDPNLLIMRPSWLIDRGTTRPVQELPNEKNLPYYLHRPGNREHGKMAEEFVTTGKGIDM
jgi:hypothetical protein